MYDSLGISLTQHETQYYWKDLRNEISRIMKPGGKVISFGWNTIGIGKVRFSQIFDTLQRSLNKIYYLIETFEINYKEEKDYNAHCRRKLIFLL